MVEVQIYICKITQLQYNTFSSLYNLLIFLHLQIYRLKSPLLVITYKRGPYFAFGQI